MKIDLKNLKGNILNKTLIYILGGIGILLVMMPSMLHKEEKITEEIIREADYCTQLEEKLESILSKISGVGKVNVMVTAKNFGEIVPAKNESNTEEEIIILNQKGGGEDIKIIKEFYPEIDGVIVVAQGGKSDIVKNNLTEAVTALLGVDVHKIRVFERKMN